jgi:DNA-binding MarR family transcriptional regulator
MSDNLQDRLANSTVALLRLSQCLSNQLGKDAAAKVGFSVLSCLASSGPLRSGDVASVVFSDPSTVSRQVAKLVAEGAIERQADPGDGRASVLALTPKGQEVLDQLQESRRQWMARIVEDWTEEEQAAFAGGFEKFVEGFKDLIPKLVEEFNK